MISGNRERLWRNTEVLSQNNEILSLNNDMIFSINSARENILGGGGGKTFYIQNCEVLS